ncbi:16961_t:CDS:2, partial [Dentiscutata heterogama]
IATLALLIINRGSIVDERNSGFASTYESRLVLIVLGVVEALTLIIWILIRFGYPKIVRNFTWLDTIWWWRIKPLDTKGIDGEAVGCFRYFAWESYSMWFRHGVVKYVGEVDENGYPHGLGEWIDDSFDGECLKGIWEYGVPIGPFHSRGSGTGDAFHSVRVGLVKNRHTPWDEWRAFPRSYQSGIETLVASVECSVSGKYFKHLPRANIILPPNPQNSAEDDNESYISPIEYCLGHLMTFASAMGTDFAAKEISTITIRLTDKGLAITGYYPISSTTSRDEVVVRRVPIKDKLNYSKKEYVIEVDEWHPSGSFSPYASTHSINHSIQRSSQECIIFIHGFNCPSKFAIETLGQFLALADLPDYIKPFVFSPPGANSL